VSRWGRKIGSHPRGGSFLEKGTVEGLGERGGCFEVQTGKKGPSRVHPFSRGWKRITRKKSFGGEFNPWEDRAAGGIHAGVKIRCAPKMGKGSLWESFFGGGAARFAWAGKV